MEEEIWKDIDGYDGVYKISSIGRIVRADRIRTRITKLGKTSYIKEPSKIMKKCLDVDGYSVTRITKDGQRKFFKVHRLVAMAFIPNPENKSEVNRINFIKDDNRVENLEWVTPKENVNHMVSNGRNNVSHGESHYASKFKESDIIEIREMYANGVVQRRLSEKYNCCPRTICSIVHGETWKCVS